jgi:hypothetical protein
LMMSFAKTRLQGLRFWLFPPRICILESHDLWQSRRLGKQGTAQSGLKWAPPKGGPQFGARPGGKDLLGKNHEAASVSWTGRANHPNSPWKVLSRGRGDRPVARSARRILRGPVNASRRRASPANAFFPEAPCPRVTTEASRDCQTLIVTPAEQGVYPRAIKRAKAGSSSLCLFIPLGLLRSTYISPG